MSTARGDDVVELEELSDPDTSTAKRDRSPARKTGRTPARSVPKKAGRPASTASEDRTGDARAESPFFAPDADGLRTLLAESPHTLEPGLDVYRDDTGKEVGAGFTSGVGDIDLLARDGDGELVVVMISEKGQGEELIAEVLQRVGWVRKHLGEGRKPVRGIVLCEDPPEGLRYAAAAVAGTVAFKSYRVALTFEDLEV